MLWVDGMLSWELWGMGHRVPTTGYLTLACAHGVQGLPGWAAHDVHMDCLPTSWNWYV